MTAKQPARVAILMGSKNDWPVIEEAYRTLEKLGIPAEAHVMSAHRTPDAVAQFARSAAERGLKVILCAAGGAAHLAGVVAAHTTLPVIGIPVSGGALNGMDALLSTVQMPGGVPVATVAVGKAGPVNAALLAAEIIALFDPAVAQKMTEHKQALQASVAKGETDLQRELS